MRAAGKLWEPYEPNDAAPWNLQRVVHLHRRAGFAATWREIERDLADGPAASVERLLHGVGDDAALAPTWSLLAEAAVEARDLDRLKAWWLHRMLFTRHPLRERLTLLWHNHFATSDAKVGNVAAMHSQNEILRAHALAPFGELLRAVLHDPAMLLFLDATSNRKEHPNENLARELMELFTLGVGHYGEHDVQEAARALTGWAIDAKSRLRWKAEHHDDDEKTILGRTGKFGLEELVDLLLGQPACAERLARRVCELLMAEGVVDDEAVRELAAGLREHGLSIEWAVATVLRSRRFFAAENLGRRVVGPVEFVVGTLRALERLEPAPSTLLAAECVTQLGQELFRPPNVFGWPGGRAWITTATVIARARFASTVVDGGLHAKAGDAAAPFDALKLARERGAADEPLDFFHRLLFGTEPDGATRAELAGAFATADRARAAITRLLAAPTASLA